MMKEFDRKDLQAFQSAIDIWRSRMYDTDTPRIRKLYQNDAQRLQQILDALKFGQIVPARKHFLHLEPVLYEQIPDDILHFLQADQTITESFHGDITKAFPVLKTRADLKDEIVSILDHTVRDRDVRDAAIQIAALLNADGYIEHKIETEDPDPFWHDTAALIIDRGNDQPTLIYDVESREFIVATPSTYIQALRDAAGVEQFLDQEDMPESQIRVPVGQQKISEYRQYLPYALNEISKETTLALLEDPEIKDLLDRAIYGGVRFIEVDDDGYVNVDGSVDFEHVPITKIPVPFGRVLGYFDCRGLGLLTLENAPEFVGGSFDCFNNQIHSLEGAPTSVGGSFECSNNQLQSLEGAPKSVDNSFFCSNNQLQSLEGAPRIVKGTFLCSDNLLHSLEGAPTYVGEDFCCTGNPLPHEEIERYRASGAVRGSLLEHRHANKSSPLADRSINMLNETIQSQYLYVYDGPGGPITKIYTADSDTDALEQAEAQSSSWFDAQENDLELEPGALVDKPRIQKKGFLAFGFMNAGPRARIYRTTAAMSSIQEGASRSSLSDFLYVYDGPDHPEGPVSVYIYARDAREAIRIADMEFVEWIEEGSNDLLLAPGEKISKRAVELAGFLPDKFEEISKYERIFYEVPSIGDQKKKEPETTTKPPAKPSSNANQRISNTESREPVKDRRVLTETRNSDVIEAFFASEFNTKRNPAMGTQNLSIRKDEQSGLWGLQNYDTWLVVRDRDGDFYFDPHRYSQTTSKIQFGIRMVARQHGIDLIETDRSGIRDILERPNPDLIDPLGRDVAYQESQAPAEDQTLVEEEKKRKKPRRGLLPAVGLSLVYPIETGETQEISETASVLETKRKSSVIDKIREQVRKDRTRTK